MAFMLTFTLVLSLMGLSVPIGVSAADCTTNVPCLTGSTFESADGNFAVDTSNGQDWASVASSPNLSKGTDLPSGSTDNSFGQGTKENDTAVTVVDGQIPPNKDDLTNFAVYSETVGGNTFVYLLWERTNNLGSAHEDFEINQNPVDPTGCLTTGGACTLNRTAGDLLITFDFGGSGFPTLTLYTWSGTAWGNPEVLGSNVANGAVYTGSTAIADPIFGGSIGAGLVGEAGVNLTAAGIFPPGECTSFADTWLKSRSSGSSFTSAMKDFIAPQPVNINNCATINIHKVTTNAPANDTTSFGYSTTGGLTPSTFSLSGGGKQQYTNVNSGSYSVTEDTPLPTGWDFVSLVCTASGSTSTSTSNQTATITVSGNGTVDCTYTNHFTNSPSISTTLSATSVNVGSSVHDSATLTGASADAGGTVTYTVYNDNTCTTSVADGGTKTVTNGVVPDSSSIDFNSAGSYYWQAVYSGDANNNGATSDCTSEHLVVNPLSPTVATTLSETLIVVGSTIHDSATLTGATADAGGTVTYTVYSDNTCTTSVADGGTKTVTNGVVPDSSSIDFNSAGDFYWQAVYSGDANNNGATSDCLSEQLAVSKASPTIATTLSTESAAIGENVHDSATLSGAFNPTGTVTYTVYTNSTCTAGAIDAGTKTLNADGSVPDSNNVSFSNAGTYYWQAVYSGDANNNGATSDCTSEVLVVNPNTPSISTLLSASTAAIGDQVHDSATLTGATADAGGTVTYTVYSDNTCTTSVANGGTKAVTNGVVPDSDAITFNNAGTYYWQAAYSGDANNNGATSDCTSEVLVVSPNNPAATTAQNLIPNDAATLTGATSDAGGTLTFNLFSPSDATCSAAPALTQTVNVSGNGTYNTTNATFIASAAGTWNWQVIYSGDANNTGFTIACGVEHFTIDNGSP